MGTPIDKSPDGMPCTVCWGIGKPFGDIPTPAIMTAVFTGISKGDLWVAGDPEPIQGAFEMSQYASCQWLYSVDGLNVFLTFDLSDSNMTAAHSGLLVQFSSLLKPVCATHFVNDNQFPTSLKYYGGVCDISLGVI